MPIAAEDILEIVRILGEEENINITVKHSLAGGLIAGLGAFAGGLILGPLGLAVGGAAGGLVGAAMYHDTFMPLCEAIHRMKYTDKMRLADAVKRVLRNIDASDAVHLMAIISGDQVLRSIVIGAIKNHLVEAGIAIAK